MVKNQRSNILKKSLLLIVSIVFCVMLAEVSLRSFISKSDFERRFDVDIKHKKILGSWFGDGFKYDDCLMNHRLILHPHLAYASKKDDNCHVKITDMGTFGSRKLKNQKPADEFSILVLGGSVASQLSMHEENSYLEHTLNQKFKHKTKKIFRIYNGAHPGWKIPNQLIMQAQLKNHFDGIIVIDGFNEFASSFMTINPWFPDPICYQLSLMQELNRNSLRKMMSSTPFRRKVLKKSYLLSVLYTYFLNQEVKDALMGGYNIEELQREYPSYLETLLESKKTIHFLQPTALSGKKLTTLEKENCLMCTPLAEKNYNKFIDAYRSIRTSSVDLSRILENRNENYYIDAVHFSAISKGNELLVDHMIPHLVKRWGLLAREK